MKDAGVAYSTLTFDGTGIAVVEADRMKLVSRVVCNMHADEHIHSIFPLPLKYQVCTPS